MSRHWNPRIVPGGRPGGRGSPPRRSRGRRRTAAAEFGLAAAAGVAIALYAASAPAAWPFGLGGEAGSPRTVHVIDGDTFDHEGVRIRIADIDTPEMRGDCAYEIRLARRATARMRSLLDEGPFELHRTGTRDEDRYGRKLRIVTRGGRSLGDVLVAEGLARTWTGRREPWC
ncbi:MAG TPA: thermonuclease family protein [Allosphingosinicella sp.]|nr:thermonuclease family protein [Allosphingosinicella sp.]